MGLLNKLKNVLFEEEEIEEVVEEPVKEFSKTTMELPKINRKPKKENYDYEEETDRELFKAEKTFDFPAFDEEEFKELVPNVKDDTILIPYDSEEKKEKEEVKKEYVEPEEKVERRKTPTYNTTRKSDYTSTRILKTTTTETPKKIFRPSPVISPVYGILDKNYKKEDVVTRDEMNEKKNITLDVDSVRKKAFGTLEEDLANTLIESTEKFYDQSSDFDVLEEKEVNVEPKVIPEEEVIENDIDIELENLLEDTVDVEIDVTKEMELPSRLDKMDYSEEPEEDEIDFSDEIEEVENEVPEQIDDIESDEDTELENDLFDLIDSMYNNGEEEE